MTKLLEDPRDQPNSPVVKWRGKLVPDPFVKNFMTKEDSNSEIFNLFFRRIGQVPIYYDMEVIAAQQAQELLESKSRYCLIGEKDYGKDKTRTLEAALGIQMKATILNYSSEDNRQPEYKRPEPERYSHWFDEVLEAMNTKYGMEFKPFEDITKAETNSPPKMANVSQDCVNQIINNYKGCWASIFASKVTNTYSRLGRSYAPTSFSKQAGRLLRVFMI